MPLVDITKPEVINFLLDSYDKTTRLRIAWNVKHAGQIKQASILNRDEKGYDKTDVLKNTIIEGMKTIARSHVDAARNRKRKPIRDGIHINTTADLKTGHSIPDVGLGDPKDDPKLARPNTDLSWDPIMRPIDPKQKLILYKDLPFYGRELYVKSRNKIQPEKKYYFEECSGWRYGWRISDSYFNKQGPSYGRVLSLTRDSKSRTGPHPDPTHYRDSDQPGLKKCDTY